MLLIFRADPLYNAPRVAEAGGAEDLSRAVDFIWARACLH